MLCDGETYCWKVNTEKDRAPVALRCTQSPWFLHLEYVLHQFFAKVVIVFFSKLRNQVIKMPSSKMKRRGDGVCHLGAKITSKQDHDFEEEDGWPV